MTRGHLTDGTGDEDDEEEADSEADVVVSFDKLALSSIRDLVCEGTVSVRSEGLKRSDGRPGLEYQGRGG